ncbi:MAG: hypothetical protein IID33_05010, partial [Planctomycetes bacterium]|nr:hypothetical protein [Planctomycetota bacterium]
MPRERTDNPSGVNANDVKPSRDREGVVATEDAGTLTQPLPYGRGSDGARGSDGESGSDLPRGSDGRRGAGGLHAFALVTMIATFVLIIVGGI